MHTDSLLTELEAARFLNIQVKTVQAWRYRGGGPKFIKLGRCVRYRRPDLEAFVSKQVRSSTSDRGPTTR